MEDTSPWHPVARAEPGGGLGSGTQDSVRLYVTGPGCHAAPQGNEGIRGELSLKGEGVPEFQSHRTHIHRGPR